MKLLRLIPGLIAVCTMTTFAFGQGASVAPAKPTSGHAHAHAKDEGSMLGKAVLLPVKSSGVGGVISFVPSGEGLLISGKVTGLSPGPHGFHVHQYGDISDFGTEAAGTAAGGHYDPKGHKHGGPASEEHHAGDLGNIEADKDGVANVQIKAPWLKLSQVIGRSIVVHGNADDLKSQPSGDSGPRVGIGIIGIASIPEK